jgi:hypothetical protein
MIAASNGFASVVELLVGYGAEADVRNQVSNKDSLVSALLQPATLL